MKNTILISIFLFSLFALFAGTYSAYSLMQSKRNLNLYYFYNHHYDMDYLASNAGEDVINDFHSEPGGCVLTYDDILISKMVADSIKHHKTKFIVSTDKQHIGNLCFGASQKVRVTVVNKNTQLWEDLNPDGTIRNSTLIKDLGNIK